MRGLVLVAPDPRSMCTTLRRLGLYPMCVATRHDFTVVVENSGLTSEASPVTCREVLDPPTAALWLVQRQPETTVNGFFDLVRYCSIITNVLRLAQMRWQDVYFPRHRHCISAKSK